jgi:signal transduction histidine kinase
VVEKERETADTITERDRAARKRAFFDVLADERRETDAALGTEREASDALVDSRDEVLAMISHDLRNLLQALLLKSAVLRDELPGEDSFAARIASEIRRSCEIMVRWAGDLVDLSSLNAGELELQYAEHDPAELLKDSVQVFLAKATRQRINLHVETAGPDAKLRCDRDRVVQVLTNLLDNAMKFTPPSGAITARLDVLDTAVEFSVSDTGPGVPEGARTKIFDRSWHTSSRRGGGRGLGLYICKRLVEHHHGRIWVDARRDRKAGSTFHVRLPLRPA